MKPLFCDTAHHRIIPPKFLLQSNIKAEKGITLKCGVPNCKGKAKFKPEVKEEIIQQVTKENIKQYWAENSGLSEDEINESLKEEIKTEEVSG